MSERQMRLRLGLFVLSMFIFMAALIIMFGAFPMLFKGGVSYTIRFTDAPNVAPGTPVRRSGVRIGEVRSVQLDEETSEVNVIVSIDPPYRVRRHETPTVMTGLLGSDTSIDFVPEQQEPGQPPLNREPVPPESTLVGARYTTVGTALSRATDILPTTQETLNDMRKSLQRLEKLTPLIEDTLKEYRDLGKVAKEMAPDVRRTVNEFGELAKSVKEAVPDGRRAIEDAAAASRNVGKLAERLDVFVQANQEKITRAIDQLTDGAQRVASLFSEENVKTIEATLRNTRRASDNFESIAINVDQATKEAKEALQEGKEAVKEGRESVRRFNGMLDRVDEILKNLQEATRPLAERSPSLLRNADEALDKINRTMGDVNALFRVLDQSDGAFRKFLTDPAIYNRIDDILCGVQRLVPRMDRILRDAETFADKLARHPESLGIGGVVRPGTGLKEPPTPPGAFRGPR